jgi:hypothetical protein
MTTSSGANGCPLAEHEAGFTALLSQQGYAPTALCVFRALMRRLRSFFERGGLGADALSEDVIAAFVASEKRAGRKFPSKRWLSTSSTTCDRSGLRRRNRP